MLGSHVAKLPARAPAERQLVSSQDHSPPARAAERGLPCDSFQGRSGGKGACSVGIYTAAGVFVSKATENGHPERQQGALLFSVMTGFASRSSPLILATSNATFLINTHAGSSPSATGMVLRYASSAGESVVFDSSMVFPIMSETTSQVVSMTSIPGCLLARVSICLTIGSGSVLSCTFAVDPPVLHGWILAGLPQGEDGSVAAVPSEGNHYRDHKFLGVAKGC